MMIISGAKGHSFEIIQILTERDLKEYIYFYDDINKDFPDKHFNFYLIIKSVEQKPKSSQWKKSRP